MGKLCSNCGNSVFAKHLGKNICAHRDRNGMIIEDPLSLAEHCDGYGEREEEGSFDCSYFGLIERQA
jgi:hypothetical protein